jgi:hypothetical protein
MIKTIVSTVTKNFLVEALEKKNCHKANNSVTLIEVIFASLSNEAL